MLSNLTLILFLIGCAGFIFSLIYLLINIIIRSQKKKLGLKLVGGFAALAIGSILVQVFSNSPESNNVSSIQANEQVSKTNETIEEEKVVTNETPKKENIIATSNVEEEKVAEEKVVTNEIPKRENIISTSNKDFSSISSEKPRSVINDKTGNWKLSRVSTSENIIEYVVGYYKSNFTNDKEIHAIVNFTLDTTTKVSKLSDNIIAVTTYEYVDKEELDANKLFSGMVLGEYWIYLDNGDIEEIK